MKTAKDMALQKGDVVTYNSKNEGEYKCIVAETPHPEATHCLVKIKETTIEKFVPVRRLKIG